MSTVPSEVFDQMVSIRRDLHQHPELSWRESRTLDQICKHLDRLGIQYRKGVAGNGVVAEIPGRNPQLPKIALRADIDALPIQEETGLPFTSSSDGVMHACGHDGHTSMLLGAAQCIVAEANLPASVRLLFQPAEETGDGAAAMIAEGALQDVGLIFGGHLDRHYPTGDIVITDGAVNASSDRFQIDIAGQGGHGARPHETIDAVVVGSLLVMAIQTIVSREINPAHPSVISVGRFNAGTASNVIAGAAQLTGTIRSQDQEVRTHLHKSLQRIAASVGQLHGARMEVTIDEGTPPVINPPAIADLAREAARRVVAEEHIIPMPTANMGGEDFGRYLEDVAGCYVRIGARFEDRDNYPAHSSKFDFNEQALGIGAAYYHSLALTAGQYLAEKQSL